MHAALPDDDAPTLTHVERTQIVQTMLALALTRLGFTPAEILLLEQQAVAMHDQVQAAIRDREARNEG